MRLTERDLNMLSALNQSEIGRDLLDYLDREKASLFDPGTLTKENLDAKKETALFITELQNRIKLINKDKAADVNEYV